MQQVERFWAIENYGLAGDVCMSVEDKKALAIMERSVKLDQGHYQVAPLSGGASLETVPTILAL